MGSGGSKDGRKKSNNGGPAQGDDKEVKRIWIYRNGDSFDPGVGITVKRRTYRNWISFLDDVTEKVKCRDGAIHKIFTVEGQEARHFTELRDQGEYVAVVTRFQPGNYGQYRPKSWNTSKPIPPEDPKTLDHKESREIYLYSRDYRPTLGDIWDDPEFDLKKAGGKEKYEEKRRKEFEKEQKEREKQKEKERKEWEKEQKEREKEREKWEKEQRKMSEQREKERKREVDERRKEREKAEREREKEQERYEKERKKEMEERRNYFQEQQRRNSEHPRRQPQSGRQRHSVY